MLNTDFDNNKIVPAKKDQHNVYKERLIRTNKKRAYYLLISCLLVICLFQAVRGVYLNTTKYIVLNNQINKLERINSVARQKNEELNKQIQSYSSTKGIEELARDNLKMVGKDEVLVIIKELPTPVVKKK
ncbi:MAG: hypothetical protein ACD_20C00225G0005 [uncultured bacterium]|nr:MAG: hypothetical protein ACD_20C00225G0005 [uncultured bacterium]HBH17511.1 hypothetical protein [Cyanobacteria bacterium UBA9579]